MKGYSIDKITGVYFRDEHKGEFIYNEGSESENLIQVIINEASDLSLGSEELTSKINNWFTLYHLSHQRSDLLRPFEDKIKGNILEIGSGCGALTRYLGELKNTQVFAIEGNSKKAEITKSRVRDLGNVNVIFENFINLELDLKFDVITMVGVLEYSRSYIASEEPVIDLLKKAKSLLKPDGILIAAIENQLGLKYFAGAPEDHVGIPFFGIENKYSLNDPTTFGKQELTNKFIQAGFEEFEFLYPFPDYKLPSVIVKKKGFKTSNFNIADLLKYKMRYIQDHYYGSVFDESKALISLLKNGILEDLSNSFLIVTGNKFEDENNILAYSYSSLRKPQFCKANLFFEENEGILVSRINTFPFTINKSKVVSQNLESEEYIVGNLYLNKLTEILETDNWNTFTIFQWAEPWINTLISKSVGVGNDGLPILSENYFDASPFNLFYNTELTFFDLEWVVKFPLKINYVVFRSLYYSLASFAKYHKIKTPRYKFVYEVALEVMSFKFESKTLDLDEFRNLELKILSEILPLKPESVFIDEIKYIETINDLISNKSTVDELMLKISFQENEIDALKEDVENFKSEREQKEITISKLIKKLENSDNEKHNLKAKVAEAIEISIIQKNRITELETENYNKLIEIKNLSKDLKEKENFAKYIDSKFNGITRAYNFLERRLRQKVIYLRAIETKLTLSEVDCKNLSYQIEVIEKSKKLEIEKVNEELSRMKNEVEKLTKNVNELNAEIDELLKDIHTQSKTIKKLSESHHDFKERIYHLEQIVETKKQTLLEINSKLIEQTLEITSLNKNIETIQRSDGWKLLKKYYKLKGKYLPENSANYKVARFVFYLFNGKTLNSIISNFSKTSKIKAAPLKPNVDDYPILKFEKFSNPTVSIVIPIFNGWEMNYNCLKSILENTNNVKYEIIIADDNSNDESQYLGGFTTNVKIIRNKTNLGFLLNCNNASKYAKGKYIHFLNNDTRVRPNWLSSLVDLLENDPKIGMCGSKLIYPNGKLQEAGGIVWNDLTAWNFGNNSEPNISEFNYVKEADYISGASILLRMEIWNKLKGFDIRYVPAYYEDTDIAFEVRNLGYKVVYQPLSEVIHFEGFSHGTEISNTPQVKSIKDYQIKNGLKFQEKWKHILQKDHFPNAENVFWARDKSRNKKTILVIDHYVPHYDKDAGSKCTFLLISLFVEMNYNVKFIGDNYFKHEPYTTRLQQMGVEVLYGDWYYLNWQTWISENGKYFDYVYLNRPHITEKYIDFIKLNTKAKIVYFGHDLHFLREKRQFDLENRPELLESSKKWKQLEFDIFNKSDVIFTVSCDEKDIINKELPHACVENIPLYFYNNPSKKINSFKNRSNLLFVGGFSHAPNVDGLLWFFDNVWKKIEAQNSIIKLIVVGSNMPKSILDLNSDRIVIKGYLSDEELDELYKTVKISIIPLRYGAGVKGKTVESIYRAIPIVSTSIGIEGMLDIKSIIKPCDNPNDFAKKILSIYNNENELVKESEQLSIYANKYFIKESIKNKINQIFR